VRSRLYGTAELVVEEAAAAGGDATDSPSVLLLPVLGYS
jgi:hypothetical protein